MVEPSTSNSKVESKAEDTDFAWLDKGHVFDMGYLETIHTTENVDVDVEKEAEEDVEKEAEESMSLNSLEDDLEDNLHLHIDLHEQENEEINSVMKKIFEPHQQVHNPIKEDVHQRLIHDLSEKAHSIESKFRQYKQDTDARFQQLHEQVLKLKKVHLNVIKTVTITASVIGSFFALLAYRHVSDAK